MEELYLVGTKEAIDKAVELFKQSDLFGKDKIFLVDIFPELTQRYMKEQGIKRERVQRFS